MEGEQSPHLSNQPAVWGGRGTLSPHLSSQPVVQGGGKITTPPVSSSVQEAGGTVTTPLQSVHQCGKAEEHYTLPHLSSESSVQEGGGTLSPHLSSVKMCRKGGECHASLHLIYMVFRPGPPSHWEAVVSSEWLLLPPELLPDWTRAKVKDMLALVQYFLSHFGVALKYKILEPIFSLTGYLNIHFACWGRTM